MRQVKHLLVDKGHVVYAAKPDDSVLQALQLMAEHGIGALLIMDGESLIGLVSERDYARKVVLKSRASNATPLREIMTAPVLSVDPDASVAECMQLCTERRIRHLPVMQTGKVVGLVSIGDLVKAVIDEQSQEIEQLQRYIAG